MFQIGDYAVCPGHGVGLVCNIEEQEFGEKKENFYILKVISNGMTVMIPTHGEEGIRKLVGQDEVESVFDLLCNHDVILDTSTWNRRQREYLAKVNTGALLEIAEVFRSLFLLKRRKGLSFGERKLFNHCQDLLVEEISIISDTEPKEIKTKIDSCFES